MREPSCEEMVADSMEGMLTSGNVVQMLAELRQQDRTLWQKIRDWFRDMAGKLKAVVDAYKGVKPDSAEGKLVADMQDVIVILESLYTDALVDAAENYNAGTQKNTAPESGGVRYSLKETVIPTREELEKKPPMKVIDISSAKTKGTFGERRSEILRNAEKIISKPYLNKDTNTLIFLTERSYTHIFSNPGEVQINAAEHLPEFIENAILTHVEAPDHGNEYADGVYTFFAAAISDRIVPVKLKVKEYPYVGQLLPKNIRKYFENNPSDYAASYDTVVLEVDEIEKSPPGSARDIAYDVAPGPEELSTIKIADLLNLVNGEYQKYIPTYADRDTAYMDAVNRGDMEAAQKMVDQAAKEAGYNSPILYHGTRSFGFTEFDLSKMDDKRSIFLTDDERIAATYSGVMGNRNVSGDAMKPLDDLSTAELVEELNSDRFGTEADEDDKYRYSYLSLKDINQFIGKVNSEIDALQGEVTQLIRQYADRKNRTVESVDTSKGNVHFEGDRSRLNDMQKASLTVMETVAKALGVQIYVYESEVGKDGKHTGANGWYDPSDGSIQIDLYAGADGKGTMLFTMAHELTHFIKQWSPAKFKVLANFPMKQYGEKGENVRKLVYYQIAKAQSNGHNLSYEEAYEEMVADSMEGMLTSGNAVQMLAQLRQQDKTLWQKIRDWFRDMAGRIKAVLEAYKGVKPDSVEGKIVADMREVTAILESLYTDALVDAAENYNAGAQKNTTAESDGVKQVTAQKRSDRIVDQIRTHLDEIMVGDSVYTIDSSNASPYVANLKEDENSGHAVFKSQGGVANRPGFGRVILGKKGAVSTVFHGNGPAKQAAFPAIKSVIEKGIEIGSDKNHNGKGFDTVTFAAPINFFGTKAPPGRCREGIHQWTRR